MYGTRETEEVAMTISTSKARRSLFPLIQHINDDATAVKITSKAGSAVLIPLTEYEALQETAYLLRSPANAQHLRNADAARRAGRGTRQALDHT